MRQVILMQGIPGAGKSTYARKLASEALAHRLTVRIVSADDFFMSPKGEYKYDPNLIPKAHEQCINEFRKALRDKVQLVIVDNTNLRSWNLTPYVSGAHEFGYPVRIIRLTVKPATAKKRNIHNVPPETIERMFQTLKSELYSYNIPIEVIEGE